MTLHRVVGLNAFSRLEKEMQYFIAVPAFYIHTRGFSILGGSKRLIARTSLLGNYLKYSRGEGGEVLSLRVHK